MNKERISYYADLTVTAVGIFAVAYIILKYLFFASLPFFISWAVAFMVRPLAVKIGKATHIPCKVLSAVLTILFVLGITAILASLIVLAVVEAGNFLSGILEGNKLYEILEKITNPISGLLGDGESEIKIEEGITDAIRGALSTLLSKIITVITSFASALPKAAFFFVITVISSVYFSLELNVVNAFVKNILPTKLSSALVKFKDSIFHALLKTVKAYAIIMLITFALMLLGLMVLGVQYSLLFAVVIALLDALPLIGIGIVLVPWGIYQLIFGRALFGIGILILFAVGVILRQIIEPKILGDSLGVHPIVSLVLLYLGYSIFGFFGILLLPLLTVALSVIFDKYKSSEVD